MQNDKAFIVYALSLLVGISTVATLVVSSGASSFPSPLYFIEHVTLALMIRGYYKSFDGSGGLYAVANGVRSYLGLEGIAIPAAAAPALQ